MNRRRNRPESDHLKTLAAKAQRQGKPAEAARLSKASDRTRRQEQIAQAAQAKQSAEDERANAIAHSNYFKRQMYEKMKVLDAELGSNESERYAQYANAPRPPPGPRPYGKYNSQEELDAARKAMSAKLDAIVREMELKAIEDLKAAGEWTEEDERDYFGGEEDDAEAS